MRVEGVDLTVLHPASNPPEDTPSLYVGFGMIVTWFMDGEDMLF